MWRHVYKDLTDATNLLSFLILLSPSTKIFLSSTAFPDSNPYQRKMLTTHVALAGASGNLGLPILDMLLNAGMYVTVLSRINGNSSKLCPHQNLTIKEVDFTSVTCIASALSGVEVVVSCLATLAIGSQNPLIDAAIAAGVKRFIPAEFGMDSQNPLAAQLPVCAPKVATQSYLLDKSMVSNYDDNKEGFTYTAIANGMFLDWGLKMGILVDLKRHTATLYNGGHVPFSATTLADVAKAVLGVIQHREQTENRVVYVQSALVTQNQLLRYARDKDGVEWETVSKSTEEIRKESLDELEKGPEAADVEAAMLGFCICGMWDVEYGCDFSAHLDNGLLGVEGLGEDGVRNLVESFL
ncbi:oxidoreductase CipA-like protein [Pleomassaria siparia CBS 279.74]|uniref:Oxidoreductase CipA-like protein n=1 Tax=Pleomassaria siparia CBS 279.74 TaxID=1314801 RepID=A0A6G1K6G9_9PLEO|nr:oxidoreductase CipA-like protein [Pleomassaria siparia CBS 279.74]